MRWQAGAVICRRVASEIMEEQHRVKLIPFVSRNVSRFVSTGVPGSMPLRNAVLTKKAESDGDFSRDPSFSLTFRGTKPDVALLYLPDTSAHRKICVEAVVPVG